MAKTYKNLYEKIYDFENLHKAYKKARKNTKLKKEVLAFSMNLEENLIHIQNELIWHTYKTSRYQKFCVYEPKKRVIMSLPFRDRVIHHALCNIIDPIWEIRFIYDSWACRPGKGTHKGIARLEGWLRKCQQNWSRVYCLKADIAKYFFSINHEILKRLIRKRIACPETLFLCYEIIDSTGTEYGIPIGNLTSQLFANVFLHELDEYVKYSLKVKFYIRYMDDFIFLSSKNHLHQLQALIEAFLSEELNLSLNNKTQIFPVESRGVDFLGFRIWTTHRLLRKTTKRRIQRRIKKIQKLYRLGKISKEQLNNSIESYKGHCKNAKTFRFLESLLKNN